jgi:hypothetical protein
MAIAKRTRAAQYPLVADFVFNYNDGFPVLATLNAASQDSNPRPTITDFGSKSQPVGMLPGSTYVANTNTGYSCYFEMISLPLGAQVIGGDVQIEVPYAGPSAATLAIGDALSGASYFTAATLLATNFTNQPTTLFNAGADPRVCTMGNATANGVTAVGQVITVSGCTGASAAYNGVFTVDSYTATSVVFTNPNLTTSLYLAGTIAAQFSPVRAALLIPGIESVGSPSGAQDASAGYDLRGTLTFSGGQAATQGRVRVRVMYTIDGRGNEVITP